jgi:hypothetical protein
MLTTAPGYATISCMENQSDFSKFIKRTATVYPNGVSVGITPNNNIIIDFADTSGDPGVVIGSYFLELKTAEEMVTMMQDTIKYINGQGGQNE